MKSEEAFEKIYGEFGINDAGYPIFKSGADWERDEIEKILLRFIKRHEFSGYSAAAKMILNSVKVRRRNERQRCEEPRACD